MSRLHKKFEEEHEDHIDESWLIPYADILTLLLALFIVLFASSEIDKAKFESIMESFKSELTGTKIESEDKGLSVSVKGEENKAPVDAQDQAQNPAPSTNEFEDAELDNLKAQLEKYVVANNLQAVVTLQDTRRGVEIALKDVLLFDSGKAVLKESSFQTLDAFVDLITTLPNPVSIEGHTDNVPIGNAAYSSNWELSSARAVSVLHYFASKDISENRMQFTGHGEFQPLYPNDTDENRQANRRVNIVILRETK
ncbi:flagellar motor protein MotB [Neobacillus niacini]|uniref:flagellar motor protein MotB n=1 Tax=Neobacillus niacini TaxID=86668 RepID=UPI002FFDB1BA